MKEKIQIQSKQIVSVDENSKELLDIVRKRGVKVPSVHLGFFKSIYAKIESPNLNGIRLGREAVKKALPGLIGSQVNFEHLGAGFVMGTILDGWINADDDNIEVVYSMFKSVYPDEYERSIELAKEGKLSVSFELLSERDTQEILEDGTIRLNDIDFVGMGHLLDNPPAEPTAKISQFAIKCKERLSHIEDRELVCASVIEKACDQVLESEHLEVNIRVVPDLFLVTTSDDHHFHVAEIDFDGNGITISGIGEGKHPEPHHIVNWQIQTAPNSNPETGKHTHRILNEIMATIKEYVKVRADKWSSDIYNNFPDSSFAVIEPAFLNGDTSDKKARHLPFKDRNGRFDLTNYRIALDQLDQILPVTNSITTEELRKNAKEELDKHVDEAIKANKTQGGVQFMTNEEKAKIKALRDKLGDLAKDVKDEDLLDDAVVAELRKEIEKTKADADEKDKEAGDGDKDEDEGEADAGDSEAGADEGKAEDGEAKADEKSEAEKFQDRITELEGKVEELENTLQAKDSEIETVRENAEKVGQMKVQLKDNEFAKDFTDEDYLNDEKVNEAIQSQKDAQTVATRKEELKDNEYVKDFTDEDYLNDDKVELAKVKAEKDELEAGKAKHNALDQQEDEQEPEMNTGDQTKGKETNYEEVIASIRQETSKNIPKQKIYTRQK